MGNRASLLAANHLSLPKNAMGTAKKLMGGSEWHKVLTV